jgi:LmbE family N-acetylglucosaminyl deacetylase
MILFRAPRRAARKGPYKTKMLQKRVTEVSLPEQVTERFLPTGQKILAVYPHTDDHMYMGASLVWMNQLDPKRQEPRNKIKVVIVSPGYHDRVVPEGETREEKAQRDQQRANERWGDWLNAAKHLGIRHSQMINFGARKTYDAGAGNGGKPYDRRIRIDRAEQRKMDRLVMKEKPTMVFVPPWDRFQKINLATRTIVENAVSKYLAKEARAGRKAEVFLVRYQTNHIPVLAHRNLEIVFSKEGVPLTQAKHKANLAHRPSPLKVHFDKEGREAGPNYGRLGYAAWFTETAGGILAADDIAQYQRMRRHASHELLGAVADPENLRSEQFEVTRLTAKGRRRPLIVEDKLEFPRPPQLQEIWVRQTTSSATLAPRAQSSPEKTQ